MPDLESVGDAVTGGVIANAVDPAAGETGYTHETHCLNCGAELLGPYCSACGQHAHVHRTLGAFWHDLLHGVLHFEGKIWRTLPLLAWKPGELTRRYIDGQRARFVSPIALFLFSVFITFAAMSLMGAGKPSLGSNSNLAAEQQRLQTSIASLEKKRDGLATAAPERAKLDEAIGEERAELETIRILQARGVRSAVLNDDSAIQTDVPFLKEMFAKAKENPELLFYKIKTNAYKFGWALIPISVPFVWLLFPFSRRFRMYDHTIFVTYSLSFMLLLLVSASVVGLVWPGVAQLAWFVPPLHMYRQLRGTYGVGRFGAIWRTLALTLFAFIAIAVFVVFLVTLGAFD